MRERSEKNTHDIIIFGTGQVARKWLPLLEKEYRILFCVDNDAEKWGKKFENYMIKPPYEIKNCEYDVAIMVSGQYRKEIQQQLVQMGISNSRIHVCRRLPLNNDEFVLYPLNAEGVQETGLALRQYDLLNAEESETGCKKVMVFCIYFSVYTKQLIENISKRYNDIEFSLLTKDAENKENIIAENLKHIYCYHTLSDLKTILAQLPLYDAMQLLWMEWEWAYFYRLIRTKTKKLNLNVGGSDFYRVGTVARDFKRKLIENADTITAETEGTIKDFKEYYGAIAQKTDLLPFGVEVLGYIKENVNVSRDSIKKKFGISTDKVIVTCGHNANRAHQHLDIIEAVSRLSEDIKRQVFFVFPMTYNQVNEEYIREVADSLDKNKLEYAILTKFMNFQEMAEYAIISDIMIHVQTTDQLSSTMLEEMYAGSIVIAGKWLPYRSLHEMGIYFIDVDTIPDVTEVLEDVVTNIDVYRVKCKGNAELIWQHSSWEALAPKWHALWD